VSAAANLFRKAIKASAALPGLFPTVYFPDDRNGNRAGFHIDGGARRNLFFEETINSHFKAEYVPLPETVDLPSVTVIRNGKAGLFLEDPYENSLVNILSSSIETMLDELATAATQRIYKNVIKKEWDFFYTEVPSKEFACAGKEHVFDKRFMRRLAGLGRTAYMNPQDTWRYVAPGIEEYKIPVSHCENKCSPTEPRFCNKSDIDLYVNDDPLNCPSPL